MGEKPRCRVLVVEDEAMIAMLVEDMVLDFQNSPTLPKPFSYQSLAEALRAALKDQPCHAKAA
jgi:DNA-binding response OmpR family regulator